MSGPVALVREHFTVSQDNRYFRRDTLTRMIGQEPNQWRHAALKELLDNALDAAESAYPPICPIIEVAFTETDSGLLLSVADNGPGIPADAIPCIADFSSNSSTKLFYRAPLRGAQGNAIKTLIGMPVALGQEHGRLEIETQGQRHSLKAGLTVTGPKLDIQQTPIDGSGTRVTALIPGSVDGYQWEPARWLLAYGLFNPHAHLQIRKIDPVFSEISENSDGQPPASQPFRDLSLPPTVAFPGNWRKFLPTDPTPAHWYRATEFRHLVYAKADKAPDQPLGDFVQEFKGLSRVWRKVIQAIPAKTVGDLLAAPDAIFALQQSLLEHTPAPQPEILGRVGKDHFRQRFDDQFLIAQTTKGKDRFWYKSRAGMIDGMPFLIEVALAETERPGGVFYGLNHSVPFTDPLSTTPLVYEGGPERLESEGLRGLLREAGALSGNRFGKTLNTVAAVHLVMPVLPTLDLGKARLAIAKPLADAIAETVELAAQTLHKEIIDWRRHQKKREQQHEARMVGDWRQQQKERERRARECLAEQDKEERERIRQERRARQELEAEQRRLRGELPTKRDVLFSLILDCYRIATEGETLHISSRDFFYAVRPEFQKIKVRPSQNADGSENTELDSDYFRNRVAEFHRDVHPLPFIDYKARGVLIESHSGREIPIGDREMRAYTLPHHEYSGILFIEKEGIWQTLKDTGGVDTGGVDPARRFDLMIASCVGYSTEAARTLLAQEQQSGLKILAWHDADPDGYDILRTLREPTERMPDHHLDVIDIGLNLEEGLVMGLPTETFTRKKALSNSLIPLLSGKERELFTGDCFEISSADKKKKPRYEWRNCQRIEINAIKPRDRVGYLERKISEALQRKSQPGEAPPAPRPPLDQIMSAADAMIRNTLRAEIRALIDKRIDLKKIEAAALDALPSYDLATEIEAALAADSQTPWREIVKRIAAEQLNADPSLSDAITGAVDQAIRRMVLEVAK